MTETVLRQLSDRPRAAMWLCLAALAGLGWLVLAAMAAAPDMLAKLCAADGPASPPLAMGMWIAMSLAMMLPTAAPMISVYMDIAGAARAKSITVVPPLVLAAGYASVWIGFSLAAALLQLALSQAEMPAWAAGALFACAGLYQFSALKHACLSKCRAPMPYFMANWSERTADVFRMGVVQGLSCLGCCWALMLLALGAGAMNLAWMAGLGMLMVLEKTLPQPKALVYGLGLGLIGAGAAMIVFA